MSVSPANDASCCSRNRLVSALLVGQERNEKENNRMMVIKDEVNRREKSLVKRTTSLARHLLKVRRNCLLVTSVLDLLRFSFTFRMLSILENAL